MKNKKVKRRTLNTKGQMRVQGLGIRVMARVVGRDIPPDNLVCPPDVFYQRQFFSCEFFLENRRFFEGFWVLEVFKGTGTNVSLILIFPPENWNRRFFKKFKELLNTHVTRLVLGGSQKTRNKCHFDYSEPYIV